MDNPLPQYPSLRDRAAARIAASPTLSRHTAMLLSIQGHKHDRFLAEAPVREILDWVRDIKRIESQQNA